GEPGDDGDREQGVGPPPAVEPGDDDRERRLVQYHRGGDADGEEDRVQLGQALHARPGEQSGGAEHGTGGHEPAPAAGVQPPAGQGRAQGGGQDGEGECGGDLRAARAQVAAHRYEEDREGVVEHAVADGLGDGEGGDDAPPVTEAATAPGPGGGGIHGKVHVV